MIHKCSFSSVQSSLTLVCYAVFSAYDCCDAFLRTSTSVTSFILSGALSTCGTAVKVDRDIHASTLPQTTMNGLGLPLVRRTRTLIRASVGALAPPSTIRILQRDSCVSFIVVPKTKNMPYSRSLIACSVARANALNVHVVTKRILVHA